MASGMGLSTPRIDRRAQGRVLLFQPITTSLEPATPIEVHPTRLRHSGDCRRRVVDRELHCVAAAPAVAPKMARDMYRRAARLAEELAERCARDPEGDRP